MEQNSRNESQLTPTQTICEGLYITVGNFEKIKSFPMVVICPRVDFVRTNLDLGENRYSNGFFRMLIKSSECEVLKSTYRLQEFFLSRR